FGTDPGGGKTTTPIGVGVQAVSPALAFQSTGSIIVATGNGVDQVILRYSATGVLDTAFGGTANGIVTTNAGGTDFANAVAVQQVAGVPALSDKIVVAGHANVNFTLGTSDISLVRYKADGTLDTTFGASATGIVTTDLGGFDNVFSIALQDQAPAEPLILVSGNTGTGGNSQMAVLRYTSVGALDTTFNTTGKVIVNLVGPGTVASGNAVVLQAVGGNVDVVVAGYD
ncbi:MAG TPA: hypothetical protein VFK92_15725, partial [Burkholderiales bacterium]|nr:hypothetical protein [Burkholderiales bacterium]